MYSLLGAQSESAAEEAKAELDQGLRVSSLQPGVLTIQLHVANCIMT